MSRLTKAIRFGLLNSLVLCICVGILKGLHEGWNNLRITNPPIPEAVFFTVLAVVQTTFGWMLIPSASVSTKTTHHEL